MLVTSTIRRVHSFVALIPDQLRALWVTARSGVGKRLDFALGAGRMEVRNEDGQCKT